MTEVLQSAKRGKNGLVAALLRTDGPGAAFIARLRLGIVVGALAEEAANGMNGRHVHHVEAHLRNLRQTFFAVSKGAVFARLRGRGAGKNSYHALKRARAGSTTSVYSRSVSVAKRLSG